MSEGHHKGTHAKIRRITGHLALLSRESPHQESACNNRDLFSMLETELRMLYLLGTCYTTSVPTLTLASWT